MSSSMLEQAVIDAEALKEAAVKNAEQEVQEITDSFSKKIISHLPIILQEIFRKARQW